MAVLGNRATGLLDMLIEGFRNQTAPQQAGSPMQSPMVADVRRTSPTQRALTQEMGRFNMQNQPLPLERGGFYEMRTPYTPTGTQMDTPIAPAPVMGRNVAPRERQIPSVIRANRLGAPVNRLIEGQQFPQGTGVGMTPEMIAASDRKPFQMDQAFLSKAEDAAKVKAAMDEDPQLAQDPTFMDQVKGYFGNRENMVKLALAFNSMRLTPDTGLAAALGSELKTIQEGKATNKTQTAVVNWLKANGYDQYVEVALQNPKAALEIFKQITQKEFAPGKSPSVSGVQYDADQRAYVVVSKDGVPTVEYLGTTRDDPVETERAKNQWDLSSKRSDEISRKADGIEEQLGLYQQALVQLNNGAESGFVRNMLPAFTKQTAALRSIAQQLGIQTINSATFGALSEKELDLALSTNMNLSLDPAELKQQIIEKMEATQKLYLEMRKKAAQLSSMRFDEYNQMKDEEAKANQKFLKKPDDVPQATWYAMTLDQKKRFYEAGDQQ